MKKHLVFTFILCSTLVASNIIAQTIWTGPMITFTKADGVDWTLEENQDRITENVWITRANTKGIFNIAQEAGFQGDGDKNFGPSPVDTEWAFGRTSDGIENLDFMTWIVATTVIDEDNLAIPPDLIDQDMVLHLISDDIYMDIKFLSWSVGISGGQGGFSYERASDSPSGIEDIGKSDKTQILIYPNPSHRSIHVSGFESDGNFRIINTNGTEVCRNNKSSGEEINVENLTPGVYFMHDSKGNTATFIKL